MDPFMMGTGTKIGSAAPARCFFLMAQSMTANGRWTNSRAKASSFRTTVIATKEASKKAIRKVTELCTTVTGTPFKEIGETARFGDKGSSTSRTGTTTRETSSTEISKARV
jgi:hypothetical protein